MRDSLVGKSKKKKQNNIITLMHQSVFSNTSNRLVRHHQFSLTTNTQSNEEH